MLLVKGALSLLAGGGAAVSGLAGLAAYARRRYRVSRTPDDVFHTRTLDGWDLRLLHYRPAPGTRPFAEPVILCHGLAANSFNLDLNERYSLARFLAGLGFHALVPDLRGREGSWPERNRWHARHDYTFDHHANLDAPALLDGALRATGARRAFWVGHSMGGMIGYVLAGREPERIAGLMTLGSPARMRADLLLTRLAAIGLLVPLDPIPQRFFAQALAPLATEHLAPIPEFSAIRANMDREVIRQTLTNVVVDVPRKLLRQLVEWAVYERPISLHGGYDYQEAIGRVRAPLLCLAAVGDRLAPPRDVQPGFELARSEDRTWLCIGEGGSSNDPTEGRKFGHLDMLLGREAPGRIYPLLARWLAERATLAGRHTFPLGVAGKAG